MTIYMIRIERANRKSIILAMVVDKTRILLGKYILVISEDELTNEPQEDNNELANSVQGRRPTKRKTE